MIGIYFAPWYFFSGRTMDLAVNREYFKASVWAVQFTLFQATA